VQERAISELPAIEQLYYTWSLVGLRKMAGWQVRAASPGLSNVFSQRYQAIERYLNYSLPEGLSPVSTQPEDAPVCLQLLDLDGDRVLMQKRFVGAAQRGPGIYFAHVLAGLPPDFSLGDAIDTWQSPFWRSSAASLPSSQFSLPLVAAGELMPRQPPFRLQGNEAVRDFLPFVIHAFLALAPTQRLYIAAPSSMVALLIFGLAAALPRPLTARVTFATYERDVGHSPATIVGTTWQPESSNLTVKSHGRDFPDELYEGQGLAINCFTGRRSKLPQLGLMADLAHFATTCLYRGETSSLSRFKEIADEIALRDVKGCLLAYRLYRGSTACASFSPEELGFLLSSPVSAKAFLPNAATRRAIIEAAHSSRPWWEQIGQKLLRQLHDPAGRLHDPEMSRSLAVLAREAVERAEDALARGDVRGADRLIGSLVKLAAPSDWARLSKELLVRTLNAPGQPRERYSWEARAWLLSLASRESSLSDLHRSHPQWLSVPWSELRHLLDLRLPSEWRQFAILSAVASRLDEPLSREEWEVVLKHREDVEKAVVALIGFCKEGSGPQPHLAPLLTRFQAGKIDVFLFVLRSSVSAPPGSALDLVASAANAASLSPREVMALVEGNLDLLLRRQLDDEIVSQLARGYLWALGEDDSMLEHAVETLRQLTANGIRARLPYKCVSAAESWIRIAEYLQNPSGDPRVVRLLGEAALAAGLPPNGKVAARLISTWAATLRTFEEVDLVLRVFGKLLADSERTLFVRLFRALCELPSEAPPGVFVAYWEAAFGHKLLPELRGELENWLHELLGSEGQNSTVATDLAH